MEEIISIFGSENPTVEKATEREGILSILDVGEVVVEIGSDFAAEGVAGGAEIAGEVVGGVLGGL